MESVFHLLEEHSTIRNIVLLVGLLYLLKTAVCLIRSLWSGAKAFFLSSLFRVSLKPSTYEWAGKIAFIIIAVFSALMYVVVTGASDGIGKQYAIQVRSV